jgi:hypothetical protein
MNDPQGQYHRMESSSAMDEVLENLVARLPGEPWKGGVQLDGKE